MDFPLGTPPLFQAFELIPLLYITHASIVFIIVIMDIYIEYYIEYRIVCNRRTTGFRV